MAQQRIKAALVGAILIGILAVNVAHAEATHYEPVSLVTTPTPPPAPISEDEISSFGCLIGGVGMVTAAYLAGPSETIMLWGGGLLTPSGTGVLAVSIIGGLGSAGCSLGATMAPTLAWARAKFRW